MQLYYYQPNEGEPNFPLEDSLDLHGDCVGRWMPVKEPVYVEVESDDVWVYGANVQTLAVRPFDAAYGRDT